MKPGQQLSAKDAATMRNESEARLRRRWQTFLRWSICTLFWTLVTQWCFGAPLIDRGFTATGGACIRAERELNTPTDQLEEGIKTEAKAFFTHAACSMAGGAWRGGYDISGHVFILVVGSGMLWLEMLPFVLRDWMGFGAARVVRDQTGRLTRIGALGKAGDDAATSSAAQPPAAVREVHDATKEKIQQTARSINHALPVPAKRTIRAYATIMALATAGLSWWMLLMTSAFFHTWFEKLSGWLFAFGALWIVYFLPRGLPVFRGVVGMPGV